MKKDKIIIVLVLIILLAGTLRFYNINNVGFHFPDEATCLMATSCLLSPVLPYCENIARPLFATFKPFFELIITLSVSLLGIHDYSALIISAIFGTLTIPLVYYLGKEMYSVKIGLLASLIIATMNIHILFSRTALSEVTALFFVTLTALVYVIGKKRDDKWYMLATGIVLGVVFGIRFLSLIFLIVIILNEMLTNRKKALKNISMILGGLLLVVAVIIFLYHIFNVSFYNVFSDTIGVMSPFNLIFQQSGTYVPAEYAGRYGQITLFSTVRTIFIYIYYLIRLVSPVVLLFMFVPIVDFIRKKKINFDIIWLSTLSLILILIQHNAARDLIIILPPIAFLSASEIYKLLTNKRTLFLVVVGIIVVTSITSAIPTFGITRGAYSEAANYLVAQNAGVIYSNNYTQKLSFYYDNVVTRFNNISELNQITNTYVVIDTSELGTNSNQEILCGYSPLKNIPIEHEYWKFYDENSWENKLIEKLDIDIINDLYHRMQLHASQQYLLIYRIEQTNSC